MARAENAKRVWKAYWEKKRAAGVATPSTSADRAAPAAAEERQETPAAHRLKLLSGKLN